MKTKIYLASLFTVAALVSGCVASRPAQYANAPNLAGPPDNQHCRVYLMRENTFQAGGASMLAFDGDKPVGTYGAKGYLVWDREPGQVRLFVTVLAGDKPEKLIADGKSRVEIIELHAIQHFDGSPVMGKLEFTAAGGATYYITQKTEVPSPLSRHGHVRLDLKEVPESVGMATLKKRERVTN